VPNSAPAISSIACRSWSASKIASVLIRSVRKRNKDGYTRVTSRWWVILLDGPHGRQVHHRHADRSNVRISDCRNKKRDLRPKFFDPISVFLWERSRLARPAPTTDPGTKDDAEPRPKPFLSIDLPVPAIRSFRHGKNTTDILVPPASNSFCTSFAKDIHWIVACHEFLKHA